MCTRARVLIKPLVPVTIVTHWRTSSRTKLACGCVCPQDAGTCSTQTRPSTAMSLAEEYLECDMGRLLVFEAGWCWRVWCSLWSTLLWMQPMVVVTERIHCHVPVHGGFWKYCSFLSRCSHLELWCIIPPFSSLYLAVFACSSGCCFWNSHWIFRRSWCYSCSMLGSTVVTCSAAVLAFFGRITHIFYVDVDLDCSVFSPFSCRMVKYAQSMLRFEPLHALFALGVWTIFLRVDVPEPA